MQRGSAQKSCENAERAKRTLDEINAKIQRLTVDELPRLEAACESSKKEVRQKQSEADASRRDASSALLCAKEANHEAEIAEKRASEAKRLLERRKESLRDLEDNLRRRQLMTEESNAAYERARERTETIKDDVRCAEDSLFKVRLQLDEKTLALEREEMALASLIKKHESQEKTTSAKKEAILQRIKTSEEEAIEAEKRANDSLEKAKRAESRAGAATEETQKAFSRLEILKAEALEKLAERDTLQRENSELSQAVAQRRGEAMEVEALARNGTEKPCSPPLTRQMRPNCDSKWAEASLSEVENQRRRASSAFELAKAGRDREEKAMERAETGPAHSLERGSHGLRVRWLD